MQLVLSQLENIFTTVNWELSKISLYQKINIVHWWSYIILIIGSIYLRHRQYNALHFRHTHSPRCRFSVQLHFLVFFNLMFYCSTTTHILSRMVHRQPTYINYSVHKTPRLVSYSLAIIANTCQLGCGFLIHWLPVCKRIGFKLAFTTYLLSTHQPAYLRSLLFPYEPTRALCSSSQQLLNVPTVTTDFGRRAFS